MGIAKEMPAKLPVREKICELMPTTSPRMLSSGPPELPGFTATSVWMKGIASSCGSCWARLSRLLAETMPAAAFLRRRVLAALVAPVPARRTRILLPGRLAIRHEAAEEFVERVVLGQLPRHLARRTRLRVDVDDRGAVFLDEVGEVRKDL